MGRPPAYIFVVRHGNRLDAADKQWHLTSPTPYDPPLTYGGWMHSRLVGTRIANILQEEELAAAAAVSPDVVRKPRSFRIVVHSSPFLRCIQTSVAISAGIASTPTKLAESLQSPVAASQYTQYFSPGNSSFNPAPSSTRLRIKKSVLRLDAFLGEWLSPDYFEHITPPPKSALMLATAKAELLRRSSYNDYPHFHARVHSTVPSQLWSNTPSRNGADEAPNAYDSYRTSALETVSQLADSLPVRAADPSESASGQESKGSQGYTYPVPAYALSPSEPIPRGYVAHARDACVSVDYQWDSSRDPISWGDGGSLPEEWATMHQRFRKGLGHLVRWYNSTENPGKMVTKTVHAPHATVSSCAVDDSDEDSEVEVEDVVVLVSHGAGCNALIGALTHQPVLADVAMSSITMAKRREGLDYHSTSLTREASPSSLDAALVPSDKDMAETYELKLFANTEHLVAPSNSAFNRRSSVASTSSASRVNSDLTSTPKEGISGSSYASSPGGSRGYFANASLGSMRRPSRAPALVMQPSVFNSNTGGGITVGSGVTSFSNTRPSRSGSGTWGLWSPKARDDEPSNEPEPLMFLNFSHEKAADQKKDKEAPQRDEAPAAPVDTDKSTSTAVGTPETKRMFQEHDQDAASQDDRSNDDHDNEERDKVAGELLPPFRVSASNGGLWGSPRPPGDAERSRDFSTSKRRWTVTDR